MPSPSSPVSQNRLSAKNRVARVAGWIAFLCYLAWIGVAKNDPGRNLLGDVLFWGALLGTVLYAGIKVRQGYLEKWPNG